MVHNIDPWEIQYSRLVGPDELFQHGVWKNRKISDAISEARKLGRLPEGLELRVARYYSVTGEEVMAASSNRTLYVAQEAGLTHVHAVNDIDSPKAYGEVQRQLRFSADKGGTGVTFWRCP